MTTWLIPLLTLTAGALVSGIVTYVSTRSKLTLDYDADLRQKRIEVYTDLWCRMEPLAKYVPPTRFRAAEVKELAESLQAWFFGTGGLFLSTATRGDYFALQEVLRRISDGWGWEDSERERLDPSIREYLRIHGSRLRTSLTRDVGTRTRPKVPGRSESIPQHVSGFYSCDDCRSLQLRFAPWFLGGTRRLTLTLRSLETQRPIKVLNWDRSHRVIRAWLPDQGGNLRERTLLVENGRLVEGPMANEQIAGGVILWRRISRGLAQIPSDAA